MLGLRPYPVREDVEPPTLFTAFAVKSHTEEWRTLDRCGGRALLASSRDKRRPTHSTHLCSSPFSHGSAVNGGKSGRACGCFASANLMGRNGRDEVSSPAAAANDPTPSGRQQRLLSDGRSSGLPSGGIAASSAAVHQQLLSPVAWAAVGTSSLDASPLIRQLKPTHPSRRTCLGNSADRVDRGKAFAFQRVSKGTRGMTHPR